MRKYRFGFLFFISCGVVGCALMRPYIVMEGGRLYPKRPEFSLVPSMSNIDADRKIDFDAIYTRKISVDYGDGEHADYYHVRFWPTGECIAIATHEEILSKDFAESFKTNSSLWSIGLYSVNRNHISFELYVGGAYNCYYGNIEKDGLRISRVDLKYEYASFIYKTPIDATYVRHKVGKMAGHPDWSPTGVLHRVSNENTHH